MDAVDGCVVCHVNANFVDEFIVIGHLNVNETNSSTKEDY